VFEIYIYTYILKFETSVKLKLFLLPLLSLTFSSSVFFPSLLFPAKHNLAQGQWYECRNALLSIKTPSFLSYLFSLNLSRPPVSVFRLIKGPFTRGRLQWSELQKVKEAKIGGYRPMNPCPLYDKTSKTLFLFFICVEGEVSEQWQIKNNTNKARLCYITSKDLGQTWTELIDLTNCPGHGLQTEQGRLIVPLYAYTSGMSCCCRCCRCFKCCCCCCRGCVSSHALSLYSDDSGKNWQFGQLFQAESNECQMAEFFDESGNSIIYCNARTEGGFREEHVSESNGHEFCNGVQKLMETGFGCQGSLVSFPSQNEDVANDESQKKNKWLLFTHPSHQCRRVSLGVYLNKTPRDPNSWSKPWIISSGPSGYSDLAYIGEGWFACLLESGEKKETEQIASVVFSYNEL
uniref:exo-alpha-sialidase n=1 Tax=Acanthochromis polyacanthus TaxID=80966 RepID=A0A3Q1FJ92_9TELE